MTQPAPNGGAAQASAPAAPNVSAPVPPPARPARLRKRHFRTVFSFILMVVAPACVAAYYLWAIAADQYASTVGFSVRKEEVGSAVEILGGITELSGSSSSDTDILYEYIKSQKMVSLLDERLDLEAIWSKPSDDPLFSYDPEGTIEDLIDYWDRMVKVYYDSGSGLIEIRVLAFEPDDAQSVAEEIFQESSDMINALSAVAREDALRYAREELTTAVERLKTAREAITRFRNTNSMVDPTADLQTQASLLGTLQAQLAESLISLDLLRETARDSDPRIASAERRAEVIRIRIEEERGKRGLVSTDADSSDLFSTLVGEYERLVVDREFAEQTYVSSLATRDGALAEARRQSRYLAAHISPTRAERAEYPQRVVILGLFTLFVFLAWSILTLVVYSLKDRR